MVRCEAYSTTLGSNFAKQAQSILPNASENEIVISILMLNL